MSANDDDRPGKKLKTLEKLKASSGHGQASPTDGDGPPFLRIAEEIECREQDDCYDEVEGSGLTEALAKARESTPKSAVVLPPIPPSISQLIDSYWPLGRTT